MNHLSRSFQRHLGQRGCHFYDSETCNFLTWEEVFKFLQSLPTRDEKDVFSEKLVETLANYNPNREYLAVHQHGDSVSVELYAHTRQAHKKF